MKQDEIIQTAVIYLMQKGVNTDELLIRRKEILEKFCTIRAKMLSDFMIKKISVSSRNYQTTYVDKVKYSDDGTTDYGYFSKYPTIMGETAWVGSVDGKCRFREYRTLSEYSSVVKSLVPKVSGYYPENDLLKVDNNEVDTLRYNALFSSPNDVATFNAEYDEFPIDDALVPQICQAMYEVYFSKISPVQPDTTNDSTQTPKQ